MRNVATCALCLEEKELQESHIIPKFIGRWFMKTSATGFMRSTQNINKRVQDLRKEYLLCKKCEQRFSDVEKPFAERIFKPHSRGQTSFPYEEWLKRVVISIQWRVILDRKHTITGMSETLLKELDVAQETFRAFLHEETNDSGAFSHHIFFLDTIETISDDDTLSWDNPNMYFLRSFDITIASNGHSVLWIYTKLPGMIIVSHIVPNNMSGWEGTSIEDHGTLQIPQVCAVEGFGDFLTSRLEIYKNKPVMSDQQRNKIEKDIEMNPSIENTQSYRAIAADFILKSLKKNNEDN